MSKKNVVLGFLGTQLDAGATDKRWERWRPTVALACREDFAVDRLELFLSSGEHQTLASQIKADIASVNPALEVRAHVLPIQDPWDFPQVYAALKDFTSSYAFQRETENYFVHLVTGTHVSQICLFLLTESRYFPARLLGSRKRRDAEAPWRAQVEVIDLDLSTYDALASRFRKEAQDSETLLKGGIPTRNPEFNSLISRMERVCLRSTEPILFTGPTGAGKTQLAARVYELRARKHLVSGKFVEVNCATLSKDTAMSTLFGHKKGAFTGAASDRQGLLRMAAGGVLMLDEVGTLGLDEQAMLLRALEDKRFLPLGADSEVRSDFQLILGTNCDLVAAVAKGTFREDLLARINMWSFHLPGLAQRREDIEPNVDYEMEQAAEALGVRVSMNLEARKAYLDFATSFAWPGNFRQLRSSIRRMATLCEGGRIHLSDVQDELAQLAERSSTVQQEGYPLVSRVFGDKVSQLDVFDQAQLEAVFQSLRGATSLAAAGRALFGASRLNKATSNDSHRLKMYLERWGLDFQSLRSQLS